jgi:membrane protein
MIFISLKNDKDILATNTHQHQSVSLIIKRLVSFIREGIWRIRLADLPRKKALLVRLVRMVLLSFRGFKKDRCQLRASALTFYSLLSIVPVVAMIFGIAKGFGFEKNLQAQILERFPGQEAVFNQIFTFALAMLENTKGGMIAGIGIIVLFWSVISLMSHIERSFNRIWRVKKSRSFGRKFADYLAFMLLSPILFFLSSSATVYITTQITHITQKISLVGAFSPIIFFSLKLIPYGLMWILFSMVYMLMPNTRVRFISGAWGGIAAGTIYQLVQWTYIAFQIGIAKYNAIYGSFAALPLFLIWLNMSWLIVLFGAELAYSHQYIDTYEFDTGDTHVSHRTIQLVGLQIAHLVVTRFSQQQSPLTVPDIADRLHLPIRLTRRIVKKLVQTNTFVEINSHSSREPAYQPGLDTNQMTIHHVIKSLDTAGDEHIPLIENESGKKMADALQTFDQRIQRLPENELLKTI